MVELNYAPYYLRAIEKLTVGLKQASGPTGIGKTSVIKEVVHSPVCQQRKCIYMANRTQLVEDIGKIPHSVVLHRDLEVVLLTLRDFRQPFYTLFDNDELFQNPIKRWNDRNPNKRVDIGAVKRACKAFEELLTERLVTIPQLIEDKINEYARLILEAFKAALRGAKKKKGPSPIFETLMDHPVVQSLFPFIAFKRRPDIRLIAMTLQKGFYGFFDGEKSLNLTSLTEDDGGYIIFLDEFDFLENDLIGLICRSPQIRDPFHLVELFYRAMTQHKLPRENYPRSKNIRTRIEAIKEVVDNLQKSGIHYPTINQFTSPLPKQLEAMSRTQRRHAKLSPAIFRTQHTISTNYLYLRETNRSFDIFTEPDLSDDAPYSALQLFDGVSSACDQIIWLFKQLRLGDDEIIYRELMRHCFENTVFPEELARISQFAHTPLQADSSELTALLAQGYSVYDIYDLQQLTDDEEVEVRHFGIHITPENILCSLAMHNLVFALSATADIPRYVHHFHLDWLRQNISVFDPDEDDIQLIQELNRQKADIRKNKVTLSLLSRLQEDDPYQQQLLDFIGAASKDEDFGNDTHEGHLKQRVELFFASLLQIDYEEKEQNTHLLFLNTFRQIQLIFDRYPRPDNGLFVVTKRENTTWFQVYDFTFQEKPFVIVFYNAKMGSIVRQNKSAQDLFDSLFWEGKPVVVVTQYLSAGNGVNLQYWLTAEKAEQRDFTHIHLLETPYFYFGKPEETLPWDEKVALLKENIWYQAKLYAGNIISEQRFLQVLSTLNDPWAWNGDYQQSKNTHFDALLNHMATFMQALGRVERVWAKMPNQTVVLSSDVYTHFQEYCGYEFIQLRQKREPFISENLRQLLALIYDEQLSLEQAQRRAKDSRLASKNDRCRQAIKHHVVRLEGVRQGNGDTEAREQWLHLRQATLKHQFQDSLLQAYDCVAESTYYHKGLLYLTPQNEIVPARLARHDTYHWHMDSLYNVVKENAVIRDYFLEKGYQLEFPPLGRHFFTPYCFQAILTGAIGEEAITALLQDEGVELEEPSDALFEVVDQKICSYPYYIDSKFYKEQTLNRFPLAEDDPLRHPKLNEKHFLESAQRKVRKLEFYHGTPVKLFYINVTSDQPRSRNYYDRDFNSVTSFEDTVIVVIQGALRRQKPNVYQQGFEYFLHDLHAALGH